MPQSGEVRPVVVGQCSAITCSTDAEHEVFLDVLDDGSLWVPLCTAHLNSGPVDGMEFVVEAYGFVPARAGLS